jgi:hypothetical protein
MIGDEKMYVCVECGEVFSDPIRWKEDRGECFGSPSYEEYLGSPCCYSNYTEAHRCHCCDEFITGGYIKTDDDLRYCENCYRNMEIGDED